MAASSPTGSQPSFERDASSFEASMHVMNRVRERKPLTFEMVAEAIEEGEIREREQDEDGNEVLTILHEWGKLAYEVVVNINERIVITACEKAR